MNYYIFIIIILLIIFFFILFFAKKIIEKIAFLPQFTSKYTGDDIIGFQFIKNIPTILITPDNNKYPNKIILYSHGNAENISEISNILTKLSNYLGISIFLYDYPSYGPSNNILNISIDSPSEKGCYENIRICYQHLCEQIENSSPSGENYRPENIIICGRSIGTGCATYLAANFPVGGLILISPFRSVVSVISSKLTFLGDIFPNEKNIKKVNTPIFILHGINDIVVPISHSEYLWSIISEENRIHFEKTHNNHNDILNDFKNIKTGFDKIINFNKS